MIDGKRSERRLRRLIKSSEPQRWHRPRAQGVHPEAVSELLVLKPKSVGNTGTKSTLHKAYTGPLPDADVLASGAKLSQINPKPLLAHILDGMSKVELVPSQFSPVPHGNPLSYQCLPIAAGVPDVNFPPLPVLGYQFGCNFKFVPTHHQALHLESIKVTHSSACQIEEAKRLQSKCTAQVPFMKIQRGLAKLKVTHKYYWQVQRQLAVTGLHWCDFVSDTKSDFTIKRIWRHDAFIASMKDKLHMYYYNFFMDLYLSVV